MHHRLLPLAVFALMLLLAASASALQQPDSTVIPVGSGLQTLFDGRGEGISALNDAAITPETFTPTCALTFEVLQRNAGYKNSFGWYNVTGNKPADSELHEFLTCNDNVGTVKTLDIKNDPSYLGGDVGFYQATGSCATIANHIAIFYSQKAYNPDGNQQNPYIHLIIYNSLVTPKAFYFAWEDLLSGGDNDFDDLTTFVTGISCSGGGGACQTGQLGICADGTLQCQNGQLECLPLNQPSGEICDGLDNDCNGETDEGDLCEPGYVCDQGTCVPECSGGEYPCTPGKVCNAQGVCVDPECLAVSCPEGTRCVQGQCVAPCDGVVCPHGQICLVVGKCVDPCTLVTCDSDQICDMGACVEKCQCAGCDSGKSCQPDGLCLADACVGVDCPPGSYCADDGTCTDTCEGASCPPGEQCTDGQCVPAPNTGGGGAGGSGFSLGGGGAASSSSSGAVGGGTSGMPAAGQAEGGCGCRSGRRDELPRGGALLLLVGLGLAARRRRPRSGRHSSADG